MPELGRLLIVDDDRPFASELVADGERLGLSVKAVHDARAFERTLKDWRPTIIVMDLVTPDSDGLEQLHVCARHNFSGRLILVSGGFELYLRMAEEIARSHKLHVIAKFTKPFRPKQFSFLLISLL
jgi:DNA-binding response OmpR family regulator